MEEEYEHLRSAHSHIKAILFEPVGGIPHFSGEDRKLPEEFREKVLQIGSLLYEAEIIAAKTME